MRDCNGLVRAGMLCNVTQRVLTRAQILEKVIEGSKGFCPWQIQRCCWETADGVMATSQRRRRFRWWPRRWRTAPHFDKRWGVEIEVIESSATAA